MTDHFRRVGVNLGMARGIREDQRLRSDLGHRDADGASFKACISIVELLGQGCDGVDIWFTWSASIDRLYRLFVRTEN